MKYSMYVCLWIAKRGEREGRRKRRKYLPTLGTYFVYSSFCIKSRPRVLAFAFVAAAVVIYVVSSCLI